jgi:ElaB/YqjD/DUF883 family membrane-anchored ribosome-binding protein
MRLRPSSVEENNMNATQNDKLVADLKLLVADADQILQSTAGQTDARLAGMRDRLHQSLHNAQSRISVVEQNVAAAAKTAAKSTDQYVHDHTWQSIGLAAAVGVAVGILAGRR